MIAQEADEKIGNLINQTDWFALADEYPKLKDEVQSEMLKHLSEAMIGFYFNQPQNAIQAIDWLVVNAQKELGFSSTSNLVLIKSIMLFEQGFYAEGADNLSSFLAQTSEHIDPKDFPAHNMLLEMCDKIRNEARPEVIRPNKDVEIPISIEKSVRGQLIYVPVNINGNEHKFIFDTGASSTFVSERFANEVGLRVTDESFNINGVESGSGKRGTIDSILIGDIIFKNPLILIGMPNETTDTIVQIDAVLGLDFIKRIVETQIYPEEKKIVFPLKKTELPLFGRNLLVANMQPYLKAYSKTDTLILHFDTAGETTDLSNVYYKKHKEELDKIGNRKTVRRGGYGGIKYIDSYQIPKFSLTVGDFNFELTAVDVLFENPFTFLSGADGSLGTDFITSFKKVIINFDEMFVKVE